MHCWSRLTERLSPKPILCPVPNPDDAVFLTRQLRTSEDLYWQKWREAIVAGGVEPGEVVMVQVFRRHELEGLEAAGHQAFGESSASFPPLEAAVLLASDTRSFLVGVTWESRDDLAEALATFRMVSAVEVFGNEGPYFDAARKVGLRILSEHIFEGPA